MAPITDELAREMIDQLQVVAHSQRAMREVLQGMQFPLFDDWNPDTSLNANPTIVTVRPKGSAPLQVVRSVLLVTPNANSTLILGSRKIPIPTAGLIVLPDLWLQLHPNDTRQLSIPAAASGYLELMGFEVPNTSLAEFMFRVA